MNSNAASSPWRKQTENTLHKKLKTANKNICYLNKKSIRLSNCNIFLKFLKPLLLKIVESYSIISRDIILRRFASDRREDKFIGESCACPAGNHIGTIWYNIERYYTRANSHSTEGRINSLANYAHPSESTMFGKHGIISIDIIPALICVQPKGGQILLRIACPAGNHFSFLVLYCFLKTFTGTIDQFPS